MVFTVPVYALSTKRCQFRESGKINGRTIATNNAKNTTNGVYTLAKRVINLSIFGLLAAAFSTESRILVTIDSSRIFSTRIFNCPDVLTHPETILSPVFAITGTGSPVTGEVSIRLSPSMITPSNGIRSPGRTKRISPTFASSASIIRTSFPMTRLTTSGLKSTASII